MKISFSHIISSHLDTLKDQGSKRLSREDVLLFYVLPAIGGILSYFSGLVVDKNAYGVSISVFAIFSGLLLNVQVALFGILQRTWKAKGDEILDAQQAQKLLERRDLLSEINTNISYLVLVCCLSVSLFLVLYMIELKRPFEVSISTFIYSHFLLTLLMVIKRSHAVFQKEFDAS
jgi:hypothetical protein